VRISLADSSELARDYSTPLISSCVCADVRDVGLFEQGLKAKKGATKLEKEDLDAAEAVLAKLEAGIEIRNVDNWSVKEVDFINRTQFITAKPVVYLVNMSEKDFLRKKNKHLPKVIQWVKENGGDPVIPYSAAFEERIYDLSPEEKAKVRTPDPLAIAYASC
jgi:obg-like ATPase 1